MRISALCSQEFSAQDSQLSNSTLQLQRSLQAFRFLTQSGRAAGRAACPHAAAARWDTAPYRIRYRTRGEWGGNGKSHSGTFCAARPMTHTIRAGRLFAAWRATGLRIWRRIEAEVARVRSSFFAGVRGVLYATSDNRRGTAG